MKNRIWKWMVAVALVASPSAFAQQTTDCHGMQEHIEQQIETAVLSQYAAALAANRARLAVMLRALEGDATVTAARERYLSIPASQRDFNAQANYLSAAATFAESQGLDGLTDVACADGSTPVMAWYGGTAGVHVPYSVAYTRHQNAQCPTRSWGRESMGGTIMPAVARELRFNPYSGSRNEPVIRVCTDMDVGPTPVQYIVPGYGSISAHRMYICSDAHMNDADPAVTITDSADIRLMTEASGRYRGTAETHIPDFARHWLPQTCVEHSELPFLPGTPGTGNGGGGSGGIVPGDGNGGGGSGGIASEDDEA